MGLDSETLLSPFHVALEGNHFRRKCKSSKNRGTSSPWCEEHLPRGKNQGKRVGEEFKKLKLVQLD